MKKQGLTANLTVRPIKFLYFFLFQFDFCNYYILS